ncbi:MAG: hypothetical protein EHM41_09040 [Chloroflexi bacterium]|nr:MAG: hypothetical protein EHM41_09040 [Chloroflexota bacterium]
MGDESERMQILELIESGKISAEEGIKLLQALDGQVELDNDPLPPPSPPATQVLVETERSSFGSSSAQSNEEVVTPHHPVMPSDVERWRKWWMIPLWIGVGITVIGAVLMFFAWRATQMSFWFACAWVPFLMGIGVMLFSLASSRMRWLHLRVYQNSGEWPRKISFSFPLPIRFIAWLIRVFGRYSKDVRDKGIDQIIMALEKTNPDEPFFLEVDDDKDGDRVEIYIG